MKQYVIDELRSSDFEKIKAYLGENYISSELDQIYWIPLDDGILTEVQVAHIECHPFYFAVDLEPARLSFELLIRTQNRVRCNCMAYATEKQRNWLIRSVDAILDKLGIKI